MAATFTFICGDDDFLVGREAKSVYAAKTEGIEDDFSKEVVEAGAQNVSEVEAVVNRFRSAVQTLSMFGDKKVVWLKNVSFLADSVTGRSEGAKKQTADLQELLQSLDPAAVDVLVTAFPVDRRRKEFKWFQKNSDFNDLKGQDSEEALIAMLQAECERLGVSIDTRAAMALVARVSGNTRLVLEESRKLAAYLGEGGGQITEKLVIELVPAFGEGDFFEVAEAFFSLDLAWTLDAIRRHFFNSDQARPLISTLQNRNRLMIQLRVLMDSGELSLGGRGFSKASFDSAARVYAEHFGGFTDKAAYNIFTQNLWYLGNKIAPSMEGLNLRRLIDFQMGFADAFIGILDRPNDQEGVMRDLAIRCLS